MFAIDNIVLMTNIMSCLTTRHAGMNSAADLVSSLQGRSCSTQNHVDPAALTTHNSVIMTMIITCCTRYLCVCAGGGGGDDNVVNSSPGFVPSVIALCAFPVLCEVPGMHLVSV